MIAITRSASITPSSISFASSLASATEWIGTLRTSMASGMRIPFGSVSRVRRRCRSSPVDGVGDVVEVGDDGAGAAALDEPAGGVDLGAHRAAGEVALGGVRRAARRRSPRRASRASGVPKWSTACGTSVAMTSTSASTVRASSAAARSLSMTASTPRRRAVGARGRPGCRRRRWRRRRSRPSTSACDGRGVDDLAAARARRRRGASPSRRGPPRSRRARRAARPPRPAGSGRSAWSAG